MRRHRVSLQYFSKGRRWLVLEAVLFCLLNSGIVGNAQTALTVYADSLVNGFQDWGWATHNYANTSPVHSGSDSVSVTIATVNYDGLQVYHPDFDSSPYSSLSFWVNGGASGGQQLQVYGLLHIGTNANVGQLHYSLAALPTNTWQQITIPLSALGVASMTNCTGFVIQSRIGVVQPTFYLDDIQFNADPPPPLVHVGVDASQTLRAADARWFGLNTAIWDGCFDTTYTSNALKELGTHILRFPGGSLSDEYHWATGRSLNNTWAWQTSYSNFVHVATNAGVQAVITVNYGTGTSNEAAAWVSNVKNNNYGFKYWEIGNECYGTWETDSNSLPHDPYTYAVRAAGYFKLMKQADLTIKIGVPVVTGEDDSANGYTNHPIYNARTGITHYGWTPVVLATLKSLGITPDFVVHHVYPEYGKDDDQTLLQTSTNWALDAADLRQMISDYMGEQGTNIQLFCTENNADAGSQGKQSTSIVNGLYLADSLAQLMKTEFNSFIWWDLRNSTDTAGDFSASLYGWRTNGDLGIIGNANTRYPTFYTFKLMQYFTQPGDTVLNTTSDYSLLSSYAARKADGALALLIINKSGVTNLNAQITLTHFFPWLTATTRAFGIAQDDAARTNSLVAGAQDIATNTVGGISTNFTATFPPYSVALYTFAPDAPTLQSIAAPGSNYVFQLQGQSGVPYVIQSSIDLIHWSPVSTNLLTSSWLNWTNFTTSVLPQQFWRAVWQP